MTKKNAPPEQELPDTEAQVVEIEPEIYQIVKERVTQTGVGLIVDARTTFEEWEKLYGFYSLLRERSRWLLGDIIRAGERYGHQYEQVVHITGKSYSRLTSLVSVCQKFADQARRRDSLPFSYHEAVAYLPPQTADKILDDAERKHWDREQIRDAAAVAQGLPTAEQKRATKEAKKNGGVTLLPPAANPEPEKAPASTNGLYWNGYQLSTKERLLYYGSERMPAEDYDKCGHHHGFAHAEALMNWLEQNGFTQQPERKEGDELCAHSPAQNPTDAPAISHTQGTNTDAPSTASASNGASVVLPDAAPKTPVTTPELERLQREYEAGTLTTQTPEAPSSGAPCVICNQPITEYDCYGVGAGIGHRYHWDCVRKEAATVGDGQPASGQTQPASAPPSPAEPTSAPSTPPKPPGSPAQRAEEALAAFIAITEEVEWDTMGKLERKKWLKLLTPTDVLIDRLQGNPPAPRK